MALTHEHGKISNLIDKIRDKRKKMLESRWKVIAMWRWNQYDVYAYF